MQLVLPFISLKSRGLPAFANRTPQSAAIRYGIHPRRYSPEVVSNGYGTKSSGS